MTFQQAINESEVRIDTRTDNPYQIGQNLLEMAGNINASEWGDDHQATARDVAQWLSQQGVRLTDYDGEEMDMARYIERYLSRI